MTGAPERPGLPRKVRDTLCGECGRIRDCDRAPAPRTTVLGICVTGKGRWALACPDGDSTVQWRCVALLAAGERGAHLHM